MPPRPVSRPECISTSPTRAMQSNTWKTAATWSTAASLASDHLGDRLDELCRDPVLRNVAGSAGLTRSVDIGARVRARQHQHACALALLANDAGRLEAVHDGHADVHQDHVRPELACQPHGFLAVTRVADHR